MYIKLRTNLSYSFLQIGLVMVVIYLTSFYGYILFHSLAEMMMVVIGFGIYMISWNSRKFISNKYFLFIGVAYFFICVFQALHALAYTDMGVFFNRGSNLTTQLWLVTRFFESFSFLAASYFISRNLRISRVIALYTFISIAVLITIFWWPIFPAAYVDGYGLTSFKKISEVVICLMYLGSIFLIFKNKSSFNSQVFKIIVAALITSIISEVMFMVNVGIHDSLNLIGHLLKILVFCLFYVAFIEIGLRKPYSILFKELKDSETKFKNIEERFRTMFDNASVSVFITDLNGNITEANKRFSIKTGYSEAELLNISKDSRNKLFGDLFDSKEFQEVKFGTQDYLEISRPFIKKNGQTMWGHTTLSTFKDDKGAARHILWIIKDITQHKEMEKAKLEFVSMASHQLRTPLTSIRLATDLLLRGVTGPIDDKQNHYLNEINDSAKVMTEMINDLLNVSRVEMGTLIIKLEPTDLTKISDKIIEELKLHVTGKNLQLTKSYAPNLPIVNFDNQIYRMIFENLLTNAICYTPANGSIEVSLSIKDDNVLLSISDTGYGIADFNKSQVFDKLFRTNTAKEINPNGTGLGLYIVKSVTERAGAKVWFESEENKGTKFFVSIPRKNT